jgi:hypothetical protein
MTRSTMSPPTMTMAKGRCESEPMPCESAAGNSPNVATSMVIMMGRRRRTAPSMAAFFNGLAGGAHLVDVLQHDDAGLHRDAEQCEESDAGRNADVGVRDQQRHAILHRRQRHVDQDQAAHLNDLNMV